VHTPAEAAPPELYARLPPPCVFVCLVFVCLVFRLLSLLRMMLFIGTRFSNLYTYLSLLRKSRTSRPIMLFLLNCTPDFLRLVCLCVWCLCVWCLCVWCLCVWCLCVWCLCVWCLCVWCHTAPGTAPGDRQEVNSIAFPSTHTQLTTQV